VLLNQTNLTAGRVGLLKEKIQKYRNFLLQNIDPEPNITGSVSKMHTTQLDIVSGMFMLLEDFAVYSHQLRKSLVDMPTTIASENRGVVLNEINYLEKLSKLKDIRSYLLFPNIDLLKLERDDRKFVSGVLKNITRDIRSRIKKITIFYRYYYRVYIKYKHVLTAIVGLYYIVSSSRDPRQKEVYSHIYIRDRHKGKAYTYILPVGLEALDYYEDLIDDIGLVFNAVLTSYIHSMSNLGKPFLVPTEYFLKGASAEDVQKWRRIVRQVNHIPVLLPTLNFNVVFARKFPRRLNRILSKRYICKLNRDIYLK
jgi:hypothetical protein